MNTNLKKLGMATAKTVAFVVVVLLLWWAFAAIAQNDLIFPQPWEVFKITFQLLGEGKIWKDLGVTLLRALVAFVVSSAVAIVLAMLSAICKSTKPFLDATVTVLSAVPTAAITLLLMILFSSKTVPIVVAFLVVFPVLYGAFQCEIFGDEQLLDVCEVYRVSTKNKVRFVFLPQIFATFRAQCRNTVALCVKVVVSGEILALPRLGLGRDVYAAKVNIETAKVLALTLLVLAVCGIFSAVLALVQRKTKW